MSFIQGLTMNAIRGMTVMLVVTACHRGSGLEETPATPIPASASIKSGDCVEARRRAAAKPDLDVDRPPAPTRQRPAAFQSMPAPVRAAVDKQGAVVKVDVVVDTLGHADMKTFRVVESTQPWFAENLRSVLPAWRFSPARLAGCKVRRVYKFSATARPKA
jgi:hypothetical protein